MEKIVVEDILKKHNCYPDQMKKLFIKDEKGGSRYDREIAAIKEIVEAAIDRAAEKMKNVSQNKDYSDLMVESILKIKGDVVYD